VSTELPPAIKTSPNGKEASDDDIIAVKSEADEEPEPVDLCTMHKLSSLIFCF
jgi:hypothetical protein